MIRQSRAQRLHNEQMDKRENVILMSEHAEIYRHSDPSLVVVWVRGGSGTPHATDGVNCNCTAAQYGIGCRHVRIVRDIGGLRAAQEAAIGEWSEIQGNHGIGEPEDKPELQQHGPYMRSDRGSGRIGQLGRGSGRASEVVSRASEGGVSDGQNTERRENGMNVQRGYGYVPAEDSGDYLRFPKEGGTIRVRLVSEPIIFIDEYEYEGKTQKKTCAAWVVLHKDIVDGKPVVTCKHLKAGMTVYGPIRNLAMDEEEWGDPINYDVKITKTGSGKDTKYSVVACKPTKIKPEEQELIDAANYDLEALYVKGADSGDNGNQSARNGVDPDDPFADD